MSPDGGATERSDPGPPPELLDSTPVRWREEPEPTPDRPRARHARHRVLGALVVLALLVTGLAWSADRLTRSREAAALDRCEARLTHASAMSDIRMGFLTYYQRPAAPGTGRAGRIHLADLMSGPARGLLPGVQRAHRVCARVHVEPWHFALVARRSAATAYAGALITLLETVAAQGNAPFHYEPTLVRLREAAGIG